MPLTLCLFRHGQTTWNALGKYQGQTDTDLDDLGKAQARAVGMRSREMSPVALYTSDLVRCRDVAAQIQNLAGLEPMPDPRLREFDFGAWAGHTREQIADKFPDEYQAWRSGDQHVRPGGGESATILRERVEAFIADVRSRHPEGLVVAVSHAAWIRSAVRWALGGHVVGVGVPSQGSLTTLTLGDHVTLESFNDRGHLLNLTPADQQPHTPAVY
jgi:broad specificity phosphatase PhoE